MIQKLQNIEDAIYTTIKNSVGVALSNRIYSLEAPQDTTLPLCTFQIVTDVVTPGLSKSISEEITLQVNFFGKIKLGAKVLRTISDTLFSDIERSVLTLSTNGAVVQGIVQGITTIEDDIINIRQEYFILVV